MIFFEPPQNHLTLRRVAHEHFGEFQRELRRAVEASFPGFGYSPDEIGRFLRLNAEPYQDTHDLLLEDGEVVAVAMRLGDLLEYVVPVLWERRYDLVVHAIQSVCAQIPTLRLNIAEGLPSHNAWYAGLLPALGFELTPRTRMAASLPSLVRLAEQREPSSISLRSMEEDWLDACVELYLDAYGRSGEWAQETADKLRESFEAPDRRASWVIAFSDGTMVGSCFGSQYGDRFYVEELAVAAAYQGRGLGRAMLLETVQRLARTYPSAEAVVLDVDRMNLPATRLYAALGFRPQTFYTVARAPR